MTGKQKKNWVQFSCLKRETKKLRDEVYTWTRSDTWSKAQYHQLQVAFIMTFMLRHPVRRDLATLNYNGEGPNTLDVKTQKVMFTQYKTSKHYGPAGYQLSRELWKLFSRIRKQHRLRNITDGHLLRNMFWGPLNTNAMTSYLSRRCAVLLPCCADKKMGCCLLRHIVISHKKRNEMSQLDREKLARECMHSAKESERYRVLEE